jgi:hypothetical protein
MQHACLGCAESAPRVIPACWPVRALPRPAERGKPDTQARARPLRAAGPVRGRRVGDLGAWERHYPSAPHRFQDRPAASAGRQAV